MVRDSAQSSSFLVPLNQDSSLSESEIGIRAQHFRQLQDLGVPLPLTCVVTAAAVREIFTLNQFLPTVTNLFQHIHWQDQATLQPALTAVSQQLTEAVQQFIFPDQLTNELYQNYVHFFDGKFLAIRPSLLYADYPTENLSDLCVKGEANLAESLLRVLARVYLPEHLLERYQEWQNDKVIPAGLLIQQMIATQSSGLVFTADPQSGNQHTILVASTWGASALSSQNFMQADTFEVDTRTWQVTQRHISVKKDQGVQHLDGLRQVSVAAELQDKPSLNDDQVLEIAKIAQTVGQTATQTQVVEWGIDANPHKPAEQLVILNIFPFQSAKKITVDLLDHHNLPSSPTKIKILTIIDQFTKNEDSQLHFSDGVGLIESDDIFHQLSKHPQALLDRNQGHLIQQMIQDCLKRYQSYVLQPPMLYRTQNFTTADFQQLDEGIAYEPNETNPYLGYRGALRILHNYDLFNVEVEALAEAHTQLNLDIGLVVPFIRSSTEFALLKKHVLSQNNLAALAQHFWLECDVPANFFQIAEYLQQQPAGILVDIGSISALLMGIDPTDSDLMTRYPTDSTLVRSLFQQLHSALQNQSIRVYVYLSRFNQTILEIATEFGVDAVLVKAENSSVAHSLLQAAEQGKTKIWP